MQQEKAKIKVICQKPELEKPKFIALEVKASILIIFGHYDF